MFRVTGSVPQSGIDASADADGATDSPGAAVAGAAVGGGVAAGPGAAQPATMIAARPRVALLLKAADRPSLIDLTSSPPSMNQCARRWDMGLRTALLRRSRCGPDHEVGLQ